MKENQHCKQCGRAVQGDKELCPECLAETTHAGYWTETILVFCAIGLGILFIITGFAAQNYHAKERALGKEWFERGAKALEAGQPQNAIVDFRTALVYDRSNDAYEFSLAKALLAAHHEDEASAHLMRLWEHTPENGEVNLEIGRLAIRNQDVTQALRFFHNSIYGDWGQQDAAEERRKARLELYRFLVSRGATSQAQAELMALAAELPPQPALHVQVGQMFFAAHEYQQAQKQFDEALQLDKNNIEALEGEGQTDFNLGDYHNAAIHIERALRKDPHNAKLQHLLEVSRLVLSIDPYTPDLPNAERTRRIMRVFQQALDRLEKCVPPIPLPPTLPAKPAATKPGQPAPPPAQPLTALQSLYVEALKMQPQVKEEILNRDADMGTAVLALVKVIEDSTAASCGPQTSLDEAIILTLGNKQGGNSK
jgi:tetratricopeptide (TPR) repeat protein